MKLAHLVNLLGGKYHCGSDKENLEVHSGCGADLMSDVIALVKEDVVLLTGLTSIQTIRSAILLDIPVVVFVRGKVPSPEMLALAEEHGIVIVSTALSLFVACGTLYEAGLRSGGTKGRSQDDALSF